MVVLHPSWFLARCSLLTLKFVLFAKKKKELLTFMWWFQGSNCRDENQLVRSIVNAVHKEMPAELQPQIHQFGLKEPLKEVLGRLHEMQGDVGILGLVGMGGIGKTTLAMEIYNHFVSLRSFQYHSFLENVRSSEPLELQR
jgi:hypothetical protein